MKLRQLFDPISCTYTYLIYQESTKEAVIIDPVFELYLRDKALIDELGLNLKYTIETHVHADHITSGWLFKQSCKSEILISSSSGATNSDRMLEHGDIIEFGDIKLKSLYTPGHTNGCMSFVDQNESMVFTGDALLIRGTGRTDFQEGSSHALYESVKNKLFSLPESCSVFPAHDYNGIMSSTIGEEKSFNPRLGGQLSDVDFIGSMDNLNLPHPKKIDEAVPANLQCGFQENGSQLSNNPKWARLSYAFAGHWDISSDELFSVLSLVQVIDVREKEEYLGPLGFIKGSKNIPLNEISENKAYFDQQKNYVFVCRAGGRSVQAIKNAGLYKNQNAASLRGGMIDWRANGFSVENGKD